MRVFLAQTRATELVAKLAALGVGEITQPTEFPPRRCPWVLDNGAFAAWRSGRSFDVEAWTSVLSSAAAAATPPVFGVCPDLVAGGRDSLAFSRRWLVDSASVLPVPWFLAAQDGMTEDDVRAAVRDGFAGVFVGGTLRWKLATAARWVAVAHELGVPCHVGRVGSLRRARWAHDVGADSIDSARPLWEPSTIPALLELAAGPRTQDVQVEAPWARATSTVAPGVGDWTPPVRRARDDDPRQQEMFPQEEE